MTLYDQKADFQSRIPDRILSGKREREGIRKGKTEFGYCSESSEYQRASFDAILLMTRLLRRLGYIKEEQDIPTQTEMYSYFCKGDIACDLTTGEELVLAEHWVM